MKNFLQIYRSNRKQTTVLTHNSKLTAPKRKRTPRTGRRAAYHCIKKKEGVRTHTNTYAHPEQNGTHTKLSEKGP
jgi:hypothetical protein